MGMQVLEVPDVCLYTWLIVDGPVTVMVTISYLLAVCRLSDNLSDNLSDRRQSVCW